MSKGKHKPSAAFNLSQRKAELLRDPARAVEYLNHALQDGDVTDFRLALADVVRSRKVAVVAKAAGIHRTTLHRMIRPTSQASLASVMKVLEACELNMLVAQQQSEEHRSWG